MFGHSSVTAELSRGLTSLLLDLGLAQEQDNDDEDEEEAKGKEGEEELRKEEHRTGGADQGECGGQRANAVRWFGSPRHVQRFAGVNLQGNRRIDTVFHIVVSSQCK